MAALFKGKSNDDEDEGASAPAVSEKAGSGRHDRRRRCRQIRRAVPMPRAKAAVASTFQLASADVADRAARKAETGARIG